MVTVKKAFKQIIALCASLAFLSSLTVEATSVMNIIPDTRESMVMSVDEGIADAFNNGKTKIQFTITGPFVEGFKAVDGKFTPDEPYFMSTDPILKYKYTAGNDYVGLKMHEVRAEVNFSYDQTSAIVKNFDVVYRVSDWHETPEETEYVEKYARENISAIIGEAQTEYDKVKNIHDWIVTNFDYAYSDTYNVKSHSAYGMLTNGRGVCSAYTLLFDILCRTAGIETRIVFSEETYAVTGSSFSIHCWNMVVVDGYWYHVDVTWDDQPHIGNGIVYNYFLKSSDYFLKNSHLWDDRSEGMGTPYPKATKNNGTAPGPSYNDNIARHTEGDKPAVIEKVTGTESSVPSVIELSSEISSSEEFDEEPAIDNETDITLILIAVVGVTVLVSVLVAVIIMRNKKVKRKTASETEKEKEESRIDSFDSYDGFDI